jgi:hypothetical protein
MDLIREIESVCGRPEVKANTKQINQKSIKNQSKESIKRTGIIVDDRPRVP